MKQIDELNFKPLQITVTNNDFEKAFRKFKMLVQKEKVIASFKEKQVYEKPSIRKRRKAREAEGRRMLAQIREQQMLSGEWEKRQKQKEQKRQKKIFDRQKND